MIRSRVPFSLILMLLPLLTDCGGIPQEPFDDVDGKADRATRRGWPLLGQGRDNASELVRTAQLLLNHRGHTLEANGVFDATTAAHTVAFQQQHRDLKNDGLIGNNTWTTLTGRELIRQGAQGYSVAAIHELLTFREHAIEQDTSQEEAAHAFGAITAAWVRKAQQERCLSQDGIVGRNTWYGLIADWNRCGSSGSSDTGTGSCPGIGFTFPLPHRATLTSRFCPSSRHAGCSRRHHGADYAASTGTSVKAACAGTVKATTWMGGYGKTIDVACNSTTLTRYAHLSRYLVRRNQTVRLGQEIGKSGATGNARGAHLHFEIRVNNKPINPVGCL